MVRRELYLQKLIDVQIPDQYEKVLLTMDRSYIKDYDGIKNVNIIDFLLKDY